MENDNEPKKQKMRKVGLFVAVLLLTAVGASAQYVPPVEEDVKERLAQWQDLKFGMFIHWGTYSQWGVIESWSLAPDDIPWQYKARMEREMDYFDYVRAYEKLKENGVMDFEKYMDGSVWSFREHMRKPDPKIFKKALNDHNIDPARAVFLDDSADNTAAAAKLGIRSILFTDIGDAKQKLGALGVR